MFAVAQELYGKTMHNWFVYISKSYASVAAMEGSEKQIYFLIYAVVGMTFSPIGEELLYRGIIHGSFATQLGERKASWVDSLAFAVTHLAHFGIVFISRAWTFFLSPTISQVIRRKSRLRK